jgi:hypothetical protein
MGGRSNTNPYMMKVMLLQMATMRRLTMSFMPNVANTKPEAINPIALRSVKPVRIALIALCASVVCGLALCAVGGAAQSGAGLVGAFGN